MKKRTLAALAFALAGCLALLPGCAGGASSAAAAAETTETAAETPGVPGQELDMATGGTTGLYYEFGSVIAQVLNGLGMGANIRIQPTGGSKANIYLVNDGEAELAIVQNDVMDYAYNGTDLFEEEGAEDGFAAVASLYTEACHIIAGEGIHSVDDLKGKRVSVGDAGSGTEFNARHILEAYGLGFDDIEVSRLSFRESAEALREGRIDAFFCTAGIPVMAAANLALEGRLNLLEIDTEHAKRLVEEHPFYTIYSIPGNSYNGIGEDIQTVAIKAALICSPTLSEELVYSLTRALFENRDEIASLHAKGTELSLELAAEGISVPFHPGAAKYYKEAGVMPR